MVKLSLTHWSSPHLLDIRITEGAIKIRNMLRIQPKFNYTITNIIVIYTGKSVAQNQKIRYGPIKNSLESTLIS